MNTPYTLKRSVRARALRLTVHPDGALTVTAPFRFGMRAIKEFVEEHMGWIERHVARAKTRAILRIARKDIPELKKKAEVLARERCAHMARLYGCSYKEIRIGAQKSRWGSCSPRGVLCFNYKLAALPPHLSDYVIVHEICHLREMNHSKKFWAQVAKTVPQYAAFRKELRNIVAVFH